MKHKLLNTDQVAAELGVTQIRVRQLIHAGLIPALKIGNSWVIDKKEFKKVLKKPPKGWPKKRRNRHAYKEFDNYFNEVGETNQ